jgi:hypothetical protein
MNLKGSSTGKCHLEFRVSPPATKNSGIEVGNLVSHFKFLSCLHIEQD